MSPNIVIILQVVIPLSLVINLWVVILHSLVIILRLIICRPLITIRCLITNFLSPYKSLQFWGIIFGIFGMIRHFGNFRHTLKGFDHFFLLKVANVMNITWFAINLVIKWLYSMYSHLIIKKIILKFIINTGKYNIFKPLKPLSRVGVFQG